MESYLFVESQRNYKDTKLLRLQSLDLHTMLCHKYYFSRKRKESRRSPEILRIYAEFFMQNSNVQIWGRLQRGSRGQMPPKAPVGIPVCLKDSGLQLAELHRKLFILNPFSVVVASRIWDLHIRFQRMFEATQRMFYVNRKLCITFKGMPLLYLFWLWSKKKAFPPKREKTLCYHNRGSWNLCRTYLEGHMMVEFHFDFVPTDRGGQKEVPKAISAWRRQRGCPFAWRVVGSSLQKYKIVFPTFQPSIFS